MQWCLLLRECGHYSVSAINHLRETILNSYPAGLIASVENSTATSMIGWIRLYNLTFIVGCAISAVVFWTLNYFAPPPGLMEESLFANGTTDGIEAGPYDEEGFVTVESHETKDRGLN